VAKIHVEKNDGGDKWPHDRVNGNGNFGSVHIFLFNAFLNVERFF
jgi:hypothetical protein